MVAVVLKNGTVFDYPDCNTQLKNGNALAVFDSSYRIIAEYPMDQIENIAKSAQTASAQPCSDIPILTPKDPSGSNELHDNPV